MYRKMSDIITTAGTYHIPVLLTQTVDLLQVNPNGTYVDVTFGGGGHSREIMRRLGKKGRLLGFDQDMDAYNNRIDDERFIFVRSNFRYLSNFLHYHDIESVDGILADLGVSSHHFDDQTRGFSFRFDGNLDMRMNQQATKTAADVLNSYTEEQLADVLYLYGELKSARRIARTIVNSRAKGEITQVQQFINLLQPHIGRDKEKKELAQVFQALRIEVNDEMEVLQKLLQASLKALKPGGRMAVLTYHSLEDRLVKNFFKSGNLEGKIEKDFYGNVLSPWKLVNNKVIIADQEEIALNPRSRSAKLRVAEKV